MLPDASARVESCREGCCRQFQIAGRQLEDAATARSQRGDDDRLCGPLPSRLHHAQPGVMKSARVSEQLRHCLRERAPRPRPGTCQIRGGERRVGGGEDYVGEWRGLKRAAVSAVHGSSTWYRTVLVGVGVGVG
jgi:hypothetical protein